MNETHGRPLDSPFIHNSINVDDDGEITTFTGGTPEAPESLVKVAGGEEGQDWYWFGDATVHGDELQVMLVEFVKTGDTMWDFQFAGNGVATFDASTLELRSIDDLATNGVNWGSAIFENPDDGYTYVYGVEDLGLQKFAHLARVAGGDLADGEWEYLGDAGWSTDPAQTKRILEGVSNEFSVSRFQGRYTLVTGDATEILSSKVVMYRSDSLEGPFTGKTVLYTHPRDGRKHLHLQREGAPRARQRPHPARHVQRQQLRHERSLRRRGQLPSPVRRGRREDQQQQQLPLTCSERRMPRGHDRPRGIRVAGGPCR